jgi:hypothetical protein
MFNIAPPPVASRFGSAIITSRSVEITADREKQVAIVGSQGGTIEVEQLPEKIQQALQKPEGLRAFFITLAKSVTTDKRPSSSIASYCLKSITDDTKPYTLTIRGQAGQFTSAKMDFSV